MQNRKVCSFIFGKIAKISLQIFHLLAKNAVLRLMNLPQHTKMFSLQNTSYKTSSTNIISHKFLPVKIEKRMGDRKMLL